MARVRVCVLPLLADGRLAPVSDVQQHQGRGPTSRQEGSHAHCIVPDGHGRFLAADLGTDQIMVYALDTVEGKLRLVMPPVAVAPGSGPRHLCFHPNGRFVYVLAELSSEIIAFHYDVEGGTLHPHQTISMLPLNYTGFSTGAHIQASPDGKFLYASNRGHDSLVIYAIDEATGLLTLVGHESTQGKTPRHFTMDAHGRFLLAANQDSDTVVVFRRDEETGRLTAVAPLCPFPPLFAYNCYPYSKEGADLFPRPIYHRFQEKLCQSIKTLKSLSTPPQAKTNPF
ncbi:MAG: lactonase family protein [Anaerolineae bacterium]|nr:lactonase family protein [Anaerolineae bacterium]